MWKKLGIFLAVLLGVSSLLSAFPGRKIESKEEIAKPTVEVAITEEAISEEPVKIDSGMTQKSESQTLSIGSQNTETTTETAVETPPLPVEEVIEELETIQDNVAVLRIESDAKDEELDKLSRENADLKRHEGSKVYVMADGIVRLNSEAIPDLGVGLTIGSRIGNHAMIEIGADYMAGNSMKDIKTFSLDKLQFRAGFGWMF